MLNSNARYLCNIRDNCKSTSFDWCGRAQNYSGYSFRLLFAYAYSVCVFFLLLSSLLSQSSMCKSEHDLIGKISIQALFSIKPNQATARHALSARSH